MIPVTKTNVQVSKITLEEMLNNPAREYNPAEYEKKVKRYSEFEGCSFFICLGDRNRPEGSDRTGYSYDRFFVSYKIEGLLLFTAFSPYSACLSNSGFAKVSIDADGFVCKQLFTSADGSVGYADNCKENRNSFRHSLTPQGIMISTDF